MTKREAGERAEKLGLSTWMVEAVTTGERSEMTTLKCVGFAYIGLTLGEAETWEEAFLQATRIIFSA